MSQVVPLVLNHFSVLQTVLNQKTVTKKTRNPGQYVINVCVRDDVMALPSGTDTPGPAAVRGALLTG